ncbi:MAG: tail fiber domain-containing protein [Bacteroidetes bacterium]|nr:tail fiber domain-containing protein [Bacteroidota bacterium]
MDVTTTSGSARGLSLSTISKGGQSTGIYNDVQGNATASYGLYTRVNPGSSGTSTNCTGVWSNCESPNSVNNQSGDFSALNATSRNWALKGYAQSVNSTSENIGVLADANRGQGYGGSSYGVKCSATGGGSAGTNYGIYSTAINAGTNWAAYFVGPGFSAATWITDSTIKKNIVDLSNATNLITQLSPKSYDFDFQKNQYLGLDQEHQYGLLAQEVEKVIPSIIKDVTDPGMVDSQGNVVSGPTTHKAINYTPLISILIAGFKEQQTQINDLKNQISNCCSSNNKTKANQIDVELSNSQTIILIKIIPIHTRMKLLYAFIYYQCAASCYHICRCQGYCTKRGNHN